MLMVELAINPLDKGQSVSAYVARAVDIIDQSGLTYQLGPMGTCIEGDWQEVIEVVQKCIQEVAKDSDRVEFTVRGDWRKDATSHLSHNIEKVERVLGRELSH